LQSFTGLRVVVALVCGGEVYICVHVFIFPSRMRRAG
jgi:hypothetical protein